jgi:uncharacterized Tic20 family protein
MQPSEDERVLAALSHASIVANIANLAGLIATSLIWSTQRERSPYVRAHALQAMIYQGAVFAISISLLLFWGVCLALSLVPAALRPDLYRSSPPYSFWLALLSLAVPIGFGITATLYGLYGAYRAYRGRPFHYPLAGRLARGLSSQPNAAPIAPATAAPSAATPAAPVPPSAVPVPTATAPLGTDTAEPAAPAQERQDDAGGSQDEAS